eukprot:s3200_g9.t1
MGTTGGSKILKMVSLRVWCRLTALLRWNADQARVEDESALVTVVTLVDKASGWPLFVQVPREGAECSSYVLNTVEQYFTLGHEKTTIQIDQENALKTVAKAIQKRMCADKVFAREALVCTKTQRRWVKAIWLGRLERDDAHILTAAEALSDGAWKARKIDLQDLERQGVEAAAELLEEDFYSSGSYAPLQSQNLCLQSMTFRR